MMGRLVQEPELAVHRPRFYSVALRSLERQYDVPAMGQTFYTAETAPPEEWTPEERAAAEAAAEEHLKQQAPPAPSPTPSTWGKYRTPILVAVTAVIILDLLRR